MNRSISTLSSADARNPKDLLRDHCTVLPDNLRKDRTAFIQTSLPDILIDRAGVQVDPETLAHLEYTIDQADSQGVERYVELIISRSFTEDLRSFNQT